MKIIICGGGRVGATIGNYLAEDDHDITIIDRNPSVVESVGETSDLLTVCGVASHPGVLEKAGARQAEMIIAATGSDETNMTACQIAHSLFKVPKKIARIGNDAYLDPQWRNLFSRDNIPIDVIISPEYEIAKAVTDRIKMPGSVNILPFSNPDYVLLGMTCLADSPADGMEAEAIKGLKSREREDLNVGLTLVVRDNEVVLPDADVFFQEGDEAYLIAPREQIAELLTFFGHKLSKTKSLIIMGGGNVGLNLVRILNRDHFGLSVTVIEQNIEQAQALSSEIPEENIVIAGDGLNKDILLEAGIRSCETFVTVSDNDEANILGALLGKKHGVANVVALTSETSYLPMLNQLGVDVTVNPRAITVSSILQYVRRGRIRSDYTIRDGFAEVIEIEADASSQVIQTPIDDIDLPEGTYILAVIRDNVLHFPDSQFAIQDADKVLVLALKGSARKIERIFAQRADYY